MWIASLVVRRPTLCLWRRNINISITQRPVGSFPFGKDSLSKYSTSRRNLWPLDLVIGFRLDFAGMFAMLQNVVCQHSWKNVASMRHFKKREGAMIGWNVNLKPNEWKIYTYVFHKWIPFLYCVPLKMRFSLLFSKTFFSARRRCTPAMLFFALIALVWEESLLEISGWLRAINQ